jgi:hypothetical protein
MVQRPLLIQQFVFTTYTATHCEVQFSGLASPDQTSCGAWMYSFQCTWLRRQYVPHPPLDDMLQWDQHGSMTCISTIILAQMALLNHIPNGKLKGHTYTYSVWQHRKPRYSVTVKFLTVVSHLYLGYTTVATSLTLQPVRVLSDKTTESPKLLRYCPASNFILFSSWLLAASQLTRNIMSFISLVENRGHTKINIDVASVDWRWPDFSDLKRHW